MQALALGWACCVWTLGVVTGVVADVATVVKWSADKVSETAAWVAAVRAAHPSAETPPTTEAPGAL